MSDTANTYDDQFDWDDPTGGGFLSNYVATIRNPEFGVDPEYRNGEVIRLHVTNELVVQDDPDIDLEPGDTITEAFNVGKDSTWETLEGGAAINRIDGKRPKPHESSGYGRLLAAVAKGAHYGDDAKTRLEGRDKLVEVLRKRGSGLTASIWDGLTFEFDRLTFSFTDRDTGEEVEYSATFPVRFIGVDAKADGPAPTSSSNGQVDEDDGVTRDDLMALAAESDSFSAFLKSAMTQYPGVEAGEHAEDLMDEKGGIYAQAKA